MKMAWGKKKNRGTINAKNSIIINNENSGGKEEIRGTVSAKNYKYE